MASMLIAWDADGNVIARCSYMARRDETGEVVGHYDFEDLELAGYSLTGLWVVRGAVGSGTWPEFLYDDVHRFRVELRPGRKGGTPLIRALVHRESGFRRERADIEQRLLAHVDRVAREKRQRGEPVEVDITEVVGGPGDRGLLLDADGRTKARFRVEVPDLPFVRRQVDEAAAEPVEAAAEPTAAELAAHLGVSLTKARAMKRQGAGG